MIAGLPRARSAATPPAAADATAPAPGFDALLATARPMAPRDTRPAAAAPPPTVDTDAAAPPEPPSEAARDWQAHAAGLVPAGELPQLSPMTPAGAPAAPPAASATPPPSVAPVALLVGDAAPPADDAPSAPAAASDADADADADSRDPTAPDAPSPPSLPPAAPSLAPPTAPAAPAAASPQPREVRPARAHERRGADSVAAAGPAVADPASRAPDGTPAPAPGFAATPAQAADAGAPASGDTRLLAHQLGTAHDAAHLDRLAREIATTAGGDARLRFALAPAALGPVHVELQRGDDGTAVRISTASHASHAALADARPQLLAEAQAHGVRISRAHVDLAAGDGSGAGHRAPADDGRRAPPAPAAVRAPAAAAEPVPPARHARDLYA